MSESWGPCAWGLCPHPTNSLIPMGARALLRCLLGLGERGSVSQDTPASWGLKTIKSVSISPWPATRPCLIPVCKNLSHQHWWVLLTCFGLCGRGEIPSLLPGAGSLAALTWLYPSVFLLSSCLTGCCGNSEFLYLSLQSSFSLCCNEVCGKAHCKILDVPKIPQMVCALWKLLVVTDFIFPVKYTAQTLQLLAPGCSPRLEGWGWFLFFCNLRGKCCTLRGRKTGSL